MRLRLRKDGRRERVGKSFDEEKEFGAVDEVLRKRRKGKRKSM